MVSFFKKIIVDDNYLVDVVFVSKNKNETFQT